MMQLHQLNHSHRGLPLPCNKHSNRRRSQEEDQDLLAEEEDQDLPVEEEDQDHPEEEEDLQAEDNPWLHNNQCLLQQMLKQWEVSHKYSMETDPKPMTSSKKSKDTSASTLMSLDTIHHKRK